MIHLPLLKYTRQNLPLAIMPSRRLAIFRRDFRLETAFNQTSRWILSRLTASTAPHGFSFNAAFFLLARLKSRGQCTLPA